MGQCERSRGDAFDRTRRRSLEARGRRSSIREIDDRAPQLDSAIVVTTITMRITYDNAKRARTLAERGLDFADAAEVFAGMTFEVEDTRRDYGEKRIVCYGHLGGRMVVVGYTERGSSRRVFSMRKANDREQARIAPYLEK